MITILVIDNDEVARNSVVELLDTDPDNNYRVLGSNFDTFAEHIEVADLVITDYKYDGVNESAGLAVYEQIRDSKFAPVIIYSGFIESIDAAIRDNQSPFLQIIEKGTSSAKALKEAVDTIVNSKEFSVKQAVEQRLTEAVNNTFREYYWKYIQANWSEFASVDSATLERVLTRKIIKDIHPTLNEEGLVHPIEFYEHPIAEASRIKTGSIIKKDQDYLVCINNDCDLEVRSDGRCKAEKLYFLPIKLVPAALSASDGDQVKRTEKNLKRLNNNDEYRDSRFFLPKTFFFPGGYVTYGDIVSQAIVYADSEISLGDGIVIVTKIHAPFIHRLISNFSNYYSRFGTPTVDVTGWPIDPVSDSATSP